MPPSGAVIDKVGTLLARSSSMNCGGNKISPLRFPSILMTPTNDLPLVMVEFKKFNTFAMAVALPLVALPAVVFAATSASPLLAATDKALFTVVSTELLLSTLLSIRLLPGEVVGCMAPNTAGSSKISPVTSPVMVVLNTTAFPSAPNTFPDDWSMFTKVASAVASPVVALPPTVLKVTPAFPVVAIEATELAIATAVAVPFDVLAAANVFPSGCIAAALSVAMSGTESTGAGPPIVVAPSGGVLTENVRCT